MAIYTHHKRTVTKLQTEVEIRQCFITHTSLWLKTAQFGLMECSIQPANTQTNTCMGTHTCIKLCMHTHTCAHTHRWSLLLTALPQHTTHMCTHTHAHTHIHTHTLNKHSTHTNTNTQKWTQFCHGDWLMNFQNLFRPSQHIRQKPLPRFLKWKQAQCMF